MRLMRWRPVGQLNSRLALVSVAAVNVRPPLFDASKLDTGPAVVAATHSTSGDGAKISSTVAGAAPRAAVMLLAVHVTPPSSVYEKSPDAEPTQNASGPITSTAVPALAY